MISKRKQELVEQYEEAAFALMMDEYAEQEGERLLREYEESAASGNIPQMPDELDSKLRAAIDSEFNKQQRLTKQKQRRTKGLKAAMIAIAALCISVTTIMSVEAWRVSILNYFVDRREDYTLFDFAPDASSENSEAAPPEDPLALLLGDEYKKVAYDPGKKGLFAVMYENSAQQIVSFSMSEATGELKVDTEGATCEKILLLQYNALLIKEEGYQLIWVDEDKQIVYNFRTTALDWDTFLQMAESLASTY